MGITKTERQVEKMFLSEISREEAISKIIEMQGQGRYFPLHGKWHEALQLGICALKHQQELEDSKDEICENICRWRVRAFETHKDVDEAEKWLDKNYCSQGCPLCRLT